MKKIFTLLAVAALGAMSMANAENRSWDFTNWSAETVANLKAGADWSDIEKAADTEPTAQSKDNCFWQVSATENVNADGYLMANNVVIAELKGLKYTNTADRSFAIAVNYPDVPNAGFGPYKGEASTSGSATRPRTTLSSPPLPPAPPSRWALSLTRRAMPAASSSM